MKRALLFLACTIVVAGSAYGQDMPPGKWWRQPEIIQNLSLTEDQQDRLENVFRGASTDLIDSRAELEKATVALRSELDRAQLNRDAIRKTAQRVNDARAKKFDRELMMLVDMRAVLNDEQWTRMRNVLDRMQHQRERGFRDKPQQRRPGQPGQQGPPPQPPPGED